MERVTLSSFLTDLLDTPGAVKVVFAWLDPEIERLCLEEVSRGDLRADLYLPEVHKDIYLVGRFDLDGDASTGDVTPKVNALRRSRNLPPVPCTLLSRLDMGGSGVWEGMMKVA